MNVIYPPNKLNDYKSGPTVFLAGSIEMGVAEEWQQRIINDPSINTLNVTLYNPRRNDWDNSWKQDPTFTPFREQVEWELNSLNKADLVFFYFAPNTKSPVSLLELGLMLGKGKKVIVCCPKEFWRWGNVKITCENEFVGIYENFNDAVLKLETTVKDMLTN